MRRVEHLVKESRRDLRRPAQPFAAGCWVKVELVSAPDAPARNIGRRKFDASEEDDLQAQHVELNSAGTDLQRSCRHGPKSSRADAATRDSRAFE